jgi:hypothetical protein
MKVYSQSQKKVVDQPTMGGGAGFGGLDEETLKQAFFLTGMKHPSQVSKLSSLYEFVKPTEEKPEAVTRIKLKGLGESGLKAVQNVRNIYESDPAILTKQLIPGKLKSRKFDSALFQAVDSLLRIRTGAAAPEKEIRRYMRSMGPTFGDSPEVVQFKLNQLESALKTESGVNLGEMAPLAPAQPSATTPAAPTTSPASAPGGKALGVAAGLASLGIPLPGVRGAAAGVMSERVPRVLGGEEMSLLQKALTSGGGIPFPVTGKEAVAAGVGGLADLLLTGAGKLIKGGGPKGLTGKAREAAAAKVKKPVSTESIKSAGEAYIKDDPLAKTYGEKILPELGEKLSQSELLRKMKVWNKAFTQAGRVGKSSKAGFYNALAKAGSELLDTGVARYNRLFKMLYGAEKIGRRMTWPAISGLGGAAGYGLAQMLGGG